MSGVLLTKLSFEEGKAQLTFNGVFRVSYEFLWLQFRSRAAKEQKSIFLD